MSTSRDTSRCTHGDAALPPLMGKRELLEWAARLSGVQPCRQYDDLRDGLVLISLAQATYPEDIPLRFLRAQKRLGQPRETTKNWELLLRCLHRHGVPATLCAHAQVSKGHARCCFNALVLFYFLHTLSSSPGSTVSVRFSSPVDPRLVQFLHSPQGQQAVQARDAPPSRSSRPPVHSQRRPSRSVLPSTSAAPSPSPAAHARAASHGRREGSSPTSSRAPSSSSYDSHREAEHSTLDTATPRAVVAELEHVKAVAQLALTQQALTAELQQRLLQGEMAQLQLELEHVRASQVRADPSAHAAAPSCAKGRTHATTEQTPEGVRALTQMVRDVLDTQINICQSVLARVADHPTSTTTTTAAEKDASEAYASLKDATETLLDRFAPLLDTLAARSPQTAHALTGLKSCLYSLATAAQALQLENARLRRHARRTDSSEVHDTSCHAASASRLSAERADHTDAEVGAPGPDLVQRLEAAMEDQAHEIAALRTSLRRTRRELEASRQAGPSARSEPLPKTQRSAHAHDGRRDAEQAQASVAERTFLQPRSVNTTSAVPRAEPLKNKSILTAAATTPSPRSLLVSADELEQRKASIFHKYAALMGVHN